MDLVTDRWFGRNPAKHTQTFCSLTRRRCVLAISRSTFHLFQIKLDHFKKKFSGKLAKFLVEKNRRSWKIFGKSKNRKFWKSKIFRRISIENFRIFEFWNFRIFDFSKNFNWNPSKIFRFSKFSIFRFFEKFPTSPIFFDQKFCEFLNLFFFKAGFFHPENRISYAKNDGNATPGTII